MVTAQLARRMAIIGWLLILAMQVATTIWIIAFFRAFPGRLAYAYWPEGTIVGPAFAALGAVVASRRPGHRLGWLFLAVGLLATVQTASGQYVVTSLALPAGVLPRADLAAWISYRAQVLTVASLVALLYLFPTGQVPPKRWRILFWATLAGMALSATAWRPALNAVATIGLVLAGGGIIGAVVWMVQRLRRAPGIEREQLKLFVYTGTVAVFLLGGVSSAFPAQTDGVVGHVMWTGGISAVAVATAIAILRYRLFDIDVIIRRTLIYTALTGALGLIYLGSVLVLGGALRAITGSAAQSQLAIVLSTLAIAALFVPLRSRVQEWIDRRFYRRKYDATQTLSRFAVTLRGETDIAALSRGLTGVVDETIQPASVSLWLRNLEKEE